MSTPKAALAVRKQAREALLDRSDLLKMSEADRQTLAEGLVVQTLVLYSLQATVAGDAEQSAALRRDAARGAREMGADVSTVTLTARGFVPR